MSYITPIQVPSTVSSYQPATGAPTIHGEVVETYEIDQSISYGELTKIRIDDATRKNVFALCKTSLDTNLISIQEARIINLGAKREIIKLNSGIVETFPIDRVIRERLIRLKQSQYITKPSEELGFGGAYLSDIATGRIMTTTKQRADKYNQYFKDQHLSEIFDLGRIFQLALREPIRQQTQKKLCEKIWIKFDDKHRQRMKEIPAEKKRNPLYKKKLKVLTTKSMTLKDAVIINRLSEKIVFDLAKDSIVKFPVLPEHITEFLSLITSKSVPKQIQKTVDSLVAKSLKSISLEIANEINSVLKEPVFDIESLLAKAIREAEEQAELVVPSKKRPVSDVGLSEPSLKKRRIENTPIPFARTQVPTIPEYDTATTMETVARPRVSSGQWNDPESSSAHSRTLSTQGTPVVRSIDLPLTTIVLDDSQFPLPTHYFQYHFTAPQQPASQQSFDLGFLLNNKKQ